MDKVKRLIILNGVSYILALFIVYIQVANTFDNLNIFVKFIIGISPWIMVAGTSFILARDVNQGMLIRSLMGLKLNLGLTG